MKIVIIQEAGRHEANKEFREALNLNRALNRILGVESIVWGLNYETFATPFSEIEVWADVIFIIENYTPYWLPTAEIANSKKLKIYWSIDSHYGGMVNQHIELCRQYQIDILLNSTESYLPMFNVDRKYWFPNSYPADLIQPLNIEKIYDIGFCGNDRPEIHYLDKFNIKKDLFVIGNDMVKAINSYKIHFNKNIANDINYRTFETAGCRTMLLTNHTPGLEKLFKIGEEVVTYDNNDDLDYKVNYYLNNPLERIKIETAGYERVIKYHTYDSRVEQLINIINDK